MHDELIICCGNIYQAYNVWMTMNNQSCNQYKIKFIFISLADFNFNIWSSFAATILIWICKIIMSNIFFCHCDIDQIRLGSVWIIIDIYLRYMCTADTCWNIFCGTPEVSTPEVLCSTTFEVASKKEKYEYILAWNIQFYHKLIHNK